MSRPNVTPAPCQGSCDCRACECKSCPNVLGKQHSDSSSHVCNHGTRPKCSCEAEKPSKKSCQPCCLNEPEPMPDPERTRSLLKVLQYDKSCCCKVVTRAVRADVHRYLGMLDRHVHKKINVPPPENPE